MADRDNTIIIGTDLDSRPAIKSLSDLKRTIKGAFTKKDTALELTNAKNELKSATKYAEKLSEEYNKLKRGEKSSAVAGLEKDLNKAYSELQRFRSEYDSTLEGNPTNKTIVKLNKDLDKANEKLAVAGEKYNQVLKGNFTSKGVTDARKNLDKLTQSVEKLEEKLRKAQAKFADFSKKEGATQEQIASRSLEVNGKTFYVDSAGNRFNPVKVGDKFFADNQPSLDTAKQLYSDIETLTNNLNDARKAMQDASAQVFKAVENEANEATENLNEAGQRVNALNNEITSAVATQAQAVQTAENYTEELNRELQAKKDAELIKAANAAADAQSNVQGLTDKIKKLEKEGKKSHSLSAAFERAKERGERLIGMMKRMTIRLLFYQTFGKAIRATVDYIKQAVAADNELSRSAAQLKGNILTAFQLIYQVLRPIILSIIQLLTWLTGAINNLIARLTGKSVSAAQKSAKAMYSLSAATGAAGKEAKKTLASFDELIQIGDKSEGASGGAPAAAAPEFVDPEQFELSQNIKDALESIWGVLKYIIAAIATWKLLEWLYNVWQHLTKIWDMLGLIGKNGAFATLMGILLIISGIIITIQYYSDAWVNGIDWGNFVGVISGLAMIVAGLGLVFGPLGVKIGLVASGLALIVLGVRDMIKYGPNLKNQLTIFIGLLGVVIGLLMSGHATLGLIIAIIGAAILIAGNFGEQWSNIMEHCGQIVDGFVKLVKDLINGDFEAAWEDAKQIVKGFANLGIDIFEGLVKAAAKAVNKIIDAINSINVTIPDWVPGVGGKSFTPNLKKISTSWSLPRFAQGAVIPPNKEFMAVLGDQKHGTNIETPLETMIQAFNAALDGRDNSQNININFTGSLAEVARLLKPQIDNETTRQGKRSSNGLIVGGNY